MGKQQLESGKARIVAESPLARYQSASPPEETTTAAKAAVVDGQRTVPEAVLAALGQGFNTGRGFQPLTGRRAAHAGGIEESDLYGGIGHGCSDQAET